MIAQGNSLQRIERWLGAILFGPTTPAGAVRITLTHAGMDEASRLLRTWELDSIPDKEAFHDLAAEIDREAAEDGEHLAWGVQRYVVRAFSVGAAVRELGSLSLRYSANALTTESGGVSDSEPASARGHVAMSMRHTDGAFRILLTGFGTITDTLIRRLSQQDHSFDQMMQNQTKLFELMQDLGNKRVERDVLADRAKKEAELDYMRQVEEMDRKNAITKLGLERIVPLIPLIANRLLGQGVVPTAATSRDEQMSGLFASFTEQQAAAIQQILSPGQLANLQDLVGGVEAARRGSHANASPGPAATGKPSEEAAYIGLREIKAKLIPWALKRMKNGESLDPTMHMQVQAHVLKLMLRALSRAQYDDLVTKDVPFDAGERKAFAGMAEALGLVPKEAAEPGAPMPPREEPKR